MKVNDRVRIKNSNVTGTIHDLETVRGIKCAWVHWDDAQHTGLNDESFISVADLELA